ncbi:MAG TPA: hypothetical protein PLQ88_13645, partial [Blastocatellia bacterium]|nr:hypothetical protein [Blastocatellia bacterium]
MTAQNYRPKVSTGSLAGRRTVSSKSTTTTRSRNSSQSARKSDARGQGARVLWILMIVGGLIGSGFVMAQHSQINVHQFRQAEEKVKNQLDELTNQQRFLALEKESAINTQESDRIAKQAGLQQLKLEGAMSAMIRTEAPAKPQTVKADTKPEVKAVVKHVAKPASQPVSKQALPVKQVAKQAGRQVAKQPVKQPVKQ